MPITGFHLTLSMGWVTELRDLTPVSRPGSGAAGCVVSSFNNYACSNFSKGEYRLHSLFYINQNLSGCRTSDLCAASATASAGCD